MGEGKRRAQQRSEAVGSSAKPGVPPGALDEDDPPFLPVRPLPGGSVCSVLVDGIEIARATYDHEGASVIQCRREGVPNGAATILRRIARELADE